MYVNIIYVKYLLKQNILITIKSNFKLTIIVELSYIRNEFAKIVCIVHYL